MPAKSKIKIRKQIEKAPDASVVKVALKSLGRLYQAEGATFEEAMSKIKVPNGAKAVAVLIVEKDGRTVEKILNGNHCQKLFGGVSPTFRSIALKQIKARVGM